MFSRKPTPRREDSDRMPLVAIWYQIRTALAELIIPLLAGLKTLWLLFITPVNFFKVVFFRTRPLDSLLTPIDPFWRTLSPEERKPLDPAHFLLFGIVTAVLAKFEFGTSNRLLSLVSDGETSLFASMITVMGDLLPAQSSQLEAILAFSESSIFVQLQDFIDPSALSVIGELFFNLAYMVVFAYLFFLFSRRRISATHSYIFWVYIAGIQFVTTAASRILLEFISLSVFDFLAVPDTTIFIGIETGLLVIWYYLYPVYTLPRIFPDEISGKQVLIAAILARGLMAIGSWLLFGGFVLVASFFGSV